MHGLDCEEDGFEWIEANDVDRSIYAFVRKSRDGNNPVVVVSNYTPVLRAQYRVGVTGPGAYREQINTDTEVHGGGNAEEIRPEQVKRHGREWSLCVTVPPSSTLILECQD